MSGYVKSFKVRDGDKVKSNKLMSFRIDDEKLLQKYKAIWTNIEDLKNIKLNVLPVCDNRYMKTKIRTYDDKVYTNFRSSNKPEDDIECECYFYCFFTCMLRVNIRDIAIISIINVDYRCIIHKISKSETINLLESSVLGDHGYT